MGMSTSSLVNAGASLISRGRPMSEDIASATLFRSESRCSKFSDREEIPGATFMRSESRSSKASNREDRLSAAKGKMGRSSVLLGRSSAMERIRVQEQDYHRYKGDLAQLREHQVPPVPNQPPKLSFKEAFELSCRQPLSPRDPWRGVNPDAGRPNYEGDLIINQGRPHTEGTKRAEAEGDKDVLASPQPPSARSSSSSHGARSGSSHGARSTSASGARSSSTSGSRAASKGAAKQPPAATHSPGTAKPPTAEPPVRVPVSRTSHVASTLKEMHPPRAPSRCRDDFAALTRGGGGCSQLSHRHMIRDMSMSMTRPPPRKSNSW